MTDTLRTTPERIAELRALINADLMHLPTTIFENGMRDALADIADLTTENERLRAEVAAKDGEIAELRRECIGLAKGVTEATRKLEAALKAGHAGEVGS